MKTLLITFLLGIVGASAVYANNPIPTGISWERQAESVNWEHAVEKGGIAINAFCSAGTILRAGEQRRETRAALELELASETGAARIRILALMLEQATERAVATESAHDRDLIAFGRISRGLSPHSFPGLLSAGNSGGCICAILLACAPAPTVSSYHAKKRTARNYFDDTVRICAGVNLIDYSFDTVKFDAYRLFLYQWNDIPSGQEKNIIPSYFHCVPRVITINPSNRYFPKTVQAIACKSFPRMLRLRSVWVRESIFYNNLISLSAHHHAPRGVSA